MTTWNKACRRTAAAAIVAVAVAAGVLSQTHLGSTAAQGKVAHGAMMSAAPTWPPPIYGATVR